MNLGEDLSQAIAMGATHAGELSFARRRYTREMDDVDIAVVGVPFDLGTSNRPGARLGPRAIREQSSLVASFFDTHSDTWGAGDDLDSGTPFFLAARGGLVDTGRSVQVGIRTPNPETHGFTVIDAERLQDMGIEATVRAIRAIVGQHPAYLSFDVDSLDPAYAPGTGTPVVGGPTTQQARRLLRGLAGLRIVGADVVEVAPPYDVAGQTALAAATMAHDLLHLIALGRGTSAEARG